MTAPTQAELDSRNAEFWDELCGTVLAGQLGITEPSPDALRRFDQAYLEMYPYLFDYLPEPEGKRSDLLEVGLGYGTVGQILAERGFRYHGLDLAGGPVSMMEYRLAQLGVEGCEAQHPGDVPQEPLPRDHEETARCDHGVEVLDPDIELSAIREQALGLPAGDEVDHRGDLALGVLLESPSGVVLVASQPAKALETELQPDAQLPPGVAVVEHHHRGAARA